MTPAGVHVGCGCGDGPLLDATPSYVAPWLCGVPLDRLAFGRRLCPGRTLTTPGLTPGFTMIQPTHRKTGTDRRPSCGCIHLEDHSDARRDLYWHTYRVRTKVLRTGVPALGSGFKLTVVFCVSQMGCRGRTLLLISTKGCRPGTGANMSTTESCKGLAEGSGAGWERNWVNPVGSICGGSFKKGHVECNVGQMKLMTLGCVIQNNASITDFKFKVRGSRF